MVVATGIDNVSKRCRREERKLDEWKNEVCSKGFPSPSWVKGSNSRGADVLHAERRRVRRKKDDKLETRVTQQDLGIWAVFFPVVCLLDEATHNGSISDKDDQNL